MSRYKSILIIFLVLALTLQMFTGIVLAEEVSPEVQLPPEIQLNKENYESIFNTLINKYKTKYITQVNNKEKRLQQLILFENIGDIEGEKVIEIPDEVMRVMEFFRELDFYGSGIKELEILWEGPTSNGQERLGEFWRSDNIIMGRPNKFKLVPGEYQGYKLIIKGTGHIDNIILNEPKGLSFVYDTTAWSVLGGDKEILPVNVYVDATKGLSIEGVTELEIDKFRNLYANPMGEPEGYEAAEYFTEKGFMPGRQMYKFKEYLPKEIKENTNEFGYTDYSVFDRLFERDDEGIKQFDALYPRDLEYIICYDNWPEWHWPDDVKNNPRGTPAIDKFDAAADLAAKYTKAYNTKMDGRGPSYIEVKNESNILNEWIYHGDDEKDSWKLLADFHNVVADKVKNLNPDVKVGGPTSAWMMLDDNNFAEAKKQLRFMDLTKDHLDFYSHHFYESKDLIINDTEEQYNGYLTGRLDAVLDLLRSHMIATNNVKPIIISETGTLHSGATDVDYWIQLKNFNSYMVKYMNRANEFEKIVPFLLPVKWWDKKSPSMLFTYDESGNLGELTPLKYYLDFWEDYKGNLLPVNSDNDKVFVHSVQNEDVIYVAINNLNPQRTVVDLALNLDGQKITNIEQTRLYLNLGKLHYETNELKNLEQIPLAVEETSIVKITLSDAPQIKDTLLKKTYYSKDMLKDTGEPMIFNVECPVDNLEKCILRVDIGRQDGFNVPMSVTINGVKTFQKDLSYSNKKGRFFSYVDIEIPTNILKNDNNIVVTIPQEGGKISTVSLINQYLLLDN